MKKNFKRKISLLVVILAFVLMVGLLGCNSTPNDSNSGDGGSHIESSNQNQESSTQGPGMCEHQVVINERVEPTCTRTGLTEGSSCSICGEVLVAQEIIEKLDHSYEVVVKEPTCIERGYTTHKCECGEEYVDSYVDALGHLYDGQYCSRCGDKLAETDSEYFDFYYSNFYGGYEIKAKDINNMPEHISIPSTYEGKPVVVIRDFAFENCTLLKSVIVPNSITGIGGQAFTNCTNLESFYMSNSIETVGGGLFDGCSNLKSVVLSNKLSGINVNMFYNCYNLQNIEIPSSVKIIGNGAFYRCESLTRMEVPEGVTKIEHNAFYMCQNLASIIIPSTVTEIGSNIFYACPRLVEIINRSSVTINTVNIQPICSVIEIHSGESKISKVGDYEYYTFDGVNYLINYLGSQKELVLPNNYNGENYKIHSHAFAHNTEITSIEIPNTVTGIGNYAFKGCSGIQSMILPFVGCDNQQTTASKASCFGYIFGNQQYEGSEKVQQYFDGGKSQTSYIPIILKSVTINGGNILYGAFNGCNNIVEVVIGDGVNLIGERSFYECASLTSVIIGDGVTEIGDAAFTYCSAITTLKLGSKITSIGERAFSYCSGLSSIVLPESLTTISAYAFYGCTGLGQITMGKNVASIGKYAFRGSSNLKDVYYGGSEESWALITIGEYNIELTNSTIHFTE